MKPSPNLKVVLPPLLRSFFEESGYCDTTYFEGRRASRLRIRCQASMCIESGPPSIKRIEKNSLVLIKDISRRGISVLAHEQIWPEESLYIRFQGRQIRAKVVRCRRLGESCWECGAEIFFFKNLEEESD
ncbi:MAG: PilZ domain-containing protein [Pirellulaceae bacterium]|nr:PilZ domain-containing protein [Pirellulaceae bacterium]